MKKVFVTQDQSMKVRRRNKELRKELTERQAKGEKNLAIRQGKIVSFNKANHTATQIYLEAGAAGGTPFQGARPKGPTT